MKKTIIIGISVVVLAIVAYYGYKWYQKRKASAPGAASSTAGNANQTVHNSVSETVVTMNQRPTGMAGQGRG